MNLQKIRSILVDQSSYVWVVLVFLEIYAGGIGHGRRSYQDGQSTRLSSRPSSSVSSEDYPGSFSCWTSSVKRLSSSTSSSDSSSPTEIARLTKLSTITPPLPFGQFSFLFAKFFSFITNRRRIQVSKLRLKLLPPPFMSPTVHLLQ